jgi:hypothetical protein
MRTLVLALSLALLAGCAGPREFSAEAPIGIERWAGSIPASARGSPAERIRRAPRSPGAAFARWSRCGRTRTSAHA